MYQQFPRIRVTENLIDCQEFRIIYTDGIHKGVRTVFSSEINHTCNAYEA